MFGIGATSFAFAIALLIASALAEHSTTTQKETSEPEQKQDEVNKFQDLRETSKHLREPDVYLERLLSEELEKRASMRGFQGMRGKKNDYALYSEPAFYPAPGVPDFSYDKRAPMGFQGMRGKKAFDDDEYDKRAPMGFQGMRGKKSLEEVIDELEKRAMLGFQGMRGKKAEEYEEPIQQEVYSELQQQQPPNEWYKRAPMGFQGMRGRKSSFLEELDEPEKRALLGFHGMRGKKGMAYEGEEIPDDGYLKKRPMMMGFHGMRGKRSTNFYARRYEKRSPYRFFGTRGKKNPRWEMRGKFVGVRGKKWTEAPRQLLILPSVYDELSLVDNERRLGATRH